MSHTGTWPRKRAPRRRSLACLFIENQYHSFQARIVDEYGSSWRVHSWPELVRIALDGHYDVYTPPWLLDGYLFGEIVTDDHCKILASKSGGVLGVTYTRGRESRTFAESRTWGWAPCAEFLTRLRRFFDYVGIGEYASPSAFGEALWSWHRPVSVSTPCAACCDDLRRYSLGGRADTPGLGARLLHAYEIDMRSAYVGFLAEVPTGTACVLQREPWGRQRGNIWFGPCEVDLRGLTTAFSPVGYRTDTGLSFPTCSDVAAGRDERFVTWLWDAEVYAARRAGAHVRLVAPGWQWTLVDYENQAYLSALWNLREYASDAQEREWIKKCGVAALGRQALPPWGYVVVDDASPWHTDDDIPLVSNNPSAPISGYWLHAQADDHHTPRVTHWWGYTLMKCRLALWERMELETQAGNTVVMSNYDGILLTEPSKGPVAVNPTYGEWKQQRLRRVFVPYPRAISSPDKVVLPGVSGEARGRYAY